MQCHSTPNTGGGSATTTTRFGRTSNGVFDPLAAEGGSLLQALAVPGSSFEHVPADANVTAKRRTPLLYGLGLVGAIPDAAIVANASHEAANNPSEAGQVAMVTIPSDGTLHVGRFGWKCQQALLLDFAGDAYDNEMGVSNAVFPFENLPSAPSVAVPSDQLEDVTDALGLRDIDRFAGFIRYLGPSPSRTLLHPGNDLGKDPVLGNGFRAFEKAGCAACHTPSSVAAAIP